MNKLTRVGDLELPQDLAYEHRAYRLRQVFSGVFCVVLAAALLGLLGRSGVLSDTTTRARDMTLEHQRFVRLKTPTELRVRLSAGEGATKIGISRDFFDDVDVEGFSVEPQDTTALADRVVFTFDQQPPSELRFVLEPRRVGRHRGVVYGPDGTRIPFTQWVWP